MQHWNFSPHLLRTKARQTRICELFITEVYTCIRRTIARIKVMTFSLPLKTRITNPTTLIAAETASWAWCLVVMGRARRTKKNIKPFDLARLRHHLTTELKATQHQTHKTTSSTP